MQKKENIVKYTMDEVLKRISQENIQPGEKFYTITDEQAERLADEQDAEILEEDGRQEITVHLDGDLMQYIASHQLNLDQSINAALRQYVVAAE